MEKQSFACLAFFVKTGGQQDIYVLFVGSLLEQYYVVWHSSRTKYNCADLEKVQKFCTTVDIGWTL